MQGRSDPASLRASVELLASEASVQEQYLRRLGTWPSADELALELDDVLPAALASGLPASVAESASALDAYLVELCGPARAELWTQEALRTAPEWERARELARAVLREMDAAGMAA